MAAAADGCPCRHTSRWHNAVRRQPARRRVSPRDFAHASGSRSARFGTGSAGRQLGQDVGQVDPGVDAVPLDRGGDAQQHGRGPQPAVPAQVQPVPAPDGTAGGSPARPGALSIVSRPSVSYTPSDGHWFVGVSDRLADRRLRQDPRRLLGQPVGERGEDRDGVLPPVRGESGPGRCSAPSRPASTAYRARMRASAVRAMRLITAWTISPSRFCPCGGAACHFMAGWDWRRPRPQASSCSATRIGLLSAG